MQRRCLTASAVLALLLVLTAASAGPDPGQERLAQAGFLPRGTEILEFRTANARHFSNGDGSIRAIIEAAGEEPATDNVVVKPGAGYSGYIKSPYFSNPPGRYLGDMTCGRWPEYSEEERAFAEWNVTSIPDGSTVLSIRCSTYCFPASVPDPPTRILLNDISSQPRTVLNDFPGNQSLFNDIGSGNTYATYENPVPPVWLAAELSAQARTDLESRLTGNWFAIGYNHYYEGSATKWEIRFKGWNQPETPVLVVDYIPFGAPGKPNLVSPPNGGTVTVFRPELRVTAISGADNYNFRVYQGGTEIKNINTGNSNNWWTLDADLTHGLTYSWDCRAHNTVDWGPYSDRWTFTVQIPLPSPPSPSSPANNASVPTLTPTLVVIAVSGADQYWFRVYEQGGPGFWQNTNAGTSWLLTTPLENGKTYLWDCAAHNVAGWGSWFSPQRSFTVRLPPVPFKPVGGVQVDTVQPELEVNAYPGATNFDFRVYTGGTQVAQGYSTTLLWRVNTNLANEQTHRWKCRAEIAGGWSDTCASAAFFVHDLPHAPVQEMPGNGSTVTTFGPKFRVTPQFDAKKYEFVVYDCPGGAERMRATSDSCAWFPPVPGLPDDNHEYEWECRVQNSASAPGWGPYCAPRWTFKVQAQVPPWPTPLSPAPSGSTVPTYLPTMTVAWIPDATKYRFRLYQGGSPVEPPIEVGVPSAQPSAPLQNATIYDWDCAAYNTKGWGGYFDPQWSFTVRVLPGAPVLTGPNNNDTTTNRRPTFSWNAAAEAQTYQIQIANNPGFSPTLYDVAGLNVLTWSPGSDLPEAKPLYWRVRGNNIAGSGSWSTRRISIDVTAPQTPTRSGPAQDTSRNALPLLDWAKLGEENRHYRLDVKKGGISLTGFPRDIPQAVGEDKSSYQFTFDALSDGEYAWTVEARDSAGNWTNPQTPAFWFRVDLTPPSIPGLVSPVGGAEVNTALPLLDWGPVEDARSFVVELYDGTHTQVPGFPKTVAQAALEDRSHYQLVSGEGLSDGVHFWRVRALDYATNASNFSAEAQFRVKLVSGGQPGWTEVKPMPKDPTPDKAPKDGAWLARHGTGMDALPVLYAAKGNKATDFYMYDPMAGDSGTWYTKEPIPASEGTKTKPPSKGCVGVSDGLQYVYMTKGNNTLGFWRYNATTNKWDSMAGVPPGKYGKRVKGGTDMVYAMHQDTGCVYLLKGYKTEFYRYNTLAARWDTLSEVPYGENKPKYDKGSFLSYDGVNVIYAHQAKYYNKATEDPYHHMFRYDVAADTWRRTGLRGMPVLGLEGGREGKKKKSSDGAAGAWFGSNLYALKGGNTQGFFKYWPDGDTWSQLDTVPGNGSSPKKKRVKAGGDLVAYSGGIFFALKGNKAYELWKFVVPTACGSQPTAASRSGVQAGLIVHRSSFIVSPNPLASGWATLRYSLPKSGPIAVTVFDVAGRSVLSQAYSAGRKASSVSLDLRRLASGVYLVRLDAEGCTVTQKLVVQR